MLDPPLHLGRAQGSGCRVQGSGCRVQGAGFRVQGSGSRVQGSRFRVQGSGSNSTGRPCSIRPFTCRKGKTFNHRSAQPSTLYPNPQPTTPDPFHAVGFADRAIYSHGTSQELLGTLGRKMQGYREKGIQTPMAQGRSTKIISMMKWIRTSRFSIKNSLSSWY